MSPSTIQEVEQAVKDMALRKAKSPNGFITEFFHFSWDIIKEEVWELVEESGHMSRVFPMLNATFFTLIPKEYKVEDPRNF